MNFVALIGVINSIEEVNNNYVISLKVEKKEIKEQKEQNDDWYDLVKVKVANTLVESALEIGDIVGIKGRIEQEFAGVLAERFQNF